MKYMIKQIGEMDGEALAELVSQLGYPASSTEVNQRLSRIKNSPEERVFVAESDLGRVIGLIHARITRNLHQPTFLEIVALVVDEKMRGQAVGRHLIEAVEAFGNECGVPQIWLRTGAHRTRAHHFYESLGYDRTTTSYKYLKKLSR